MKRLGRVQELVLVSLSTLTYGPKTTVQLANDWPGMHDGSVYNALMSLNRRGYAEPVGWDGNARLWDITDRGEEAVKELDAEAITEAELA